MSFCAPIKYADERIFDYGSTLTGNICRISLDNFEQHYNELDPIHFRYLINNNDYLQLAAMRKEIKNLHSCFCNLYARTWNDLLGLIDLGFTEVYITEELCFNLPAVKALCAKNNVRVRAFPNIAQGHSFHSFPNLRRFFILPQDIPFYSKYIDTFELYFPPHTPASKISQIFNTYKNNLSYAQIADIIIGADSAIKPEELNPLFGIMRANCQYGCMRNGKDCQICKKMEITTNEANTNNENNQEEQSNN